MCAGDGSMLKSYVLRDDNEVQLVFTMRNLAREDTPLPYEELSVAGAFEYKCSATVKAQAKLPSARSCNYECSKKRWEGDKSDGSNHM